MKSPYLKYNLKTINYFICLLLATYLCGCNNPNSNQRFINETYIEEKIDSLEMKEALNFKDTLLNRFKVSSIEKQTNTCYHLLFYSTRGHGESIKFEKYDTSYFISVKCYSKDSDFRDCKNIETQITFAEWQVFENMIYEYNFWTENQLESSNRNVLDGYGVLLEGNRPEAKNYGKRTHHFIGRSSPEFDKMGDLCRNIIYYTETLESKYSYFKIH